MPHREFSVRAYRLAAATFIVLLSGLHAGRAQASEALAQTHTCTACHAASERVVGPSFREIAERYASQSDAQALLVQTIKNGSSGRWGAIPMPASAQVSDADAQTLIRWILNTK